MAWTTTSNDVATVSSTGLVTATGPGVIQITATIKGFTGTITAGSTITVTGGSGGTGLRRRGRFFRHHSQFAVCGRA